MSSEAIGGELTDPGQILVYKLELIRATERTIKFAILSFATCFCVGVLAYFLREIFTSDFSLWKLMIVLASPNGILWVIISTGAKIVERQHQHRLERIKSPAKPE